MCLARDQAKQTPAAMPAPVQRQTWTDDNSSKPHAAAPSSASPASSSSSAFPNRPPLHTEELPDADPELRLREFALIYATYMTYLACRRNYGFWLPSVLTRLGKTKGEAGAIGSSFEMSYGACSLLNGVLIDAVSPRKLLISGLLLTGLINLCVGEVDYLPAIALLWASNGAVQSVGWPSVTNIFLAWFPDPAARGAWYSLLSTCQNAGAALVPLVVAAAISHTGWKAALWAPAALSACTALVLAVWLHGSPAEARRHARAKQLKRSGGGADDASNGSSSNTSSPSSLRCLHGAPRLCAGPTGCAQPVALGDGDQLLWRLARALVPFRLVVGLSDRSQGPAALTRRALPIPTRGGRLRRLSCRWCRLRLGLRRASRTCGCDLLGDARSLILLLRVTQSPYSLQAIYCGAHLSLQTYPNTSRRHLVDVTSPHTSPAPYPLPSPFPLASLRAPPLLHHLLSLSWQV